MEAATRRLAIVSVSLGICIVTLVPVQAGLVESLRSASFPAESVSIGFRTFSVFDALQNILLFAPLGYLLAAGQRGKSTRGLWQAAFACVALSAAVECAQAWIPGRFPSCWDVLFNTAGGIIGARVLPFARSAVPSFF
jgi:glycopeptide antibiotics resistance protein